MNVAVIPARGGSKGLPKKNIMQFCGQPLIAWSIAQAQGAKQIDEVYVSSDCSEILEIAQSYGAKAIKRPDDISGDLATSESVWLHAIEELTTSGQKIDLMVGIQATSPIRESKDLEAGIETMRNQQLDSLFSAARINDFYIWRQGPDAFTSLNYDFKVRKRRQEFGDQYLENGSFYIFKPQIIKQYSNRLGGKIGVSIMEIWKSFELDNIDDHKFLEVLMRAYLM